MKFQALSKQFLKTNWVRMFVSLIISSIILINIDSAIIIFTFIFTLFFISKSVDKLEKLVNIYMITQILLGLYLLYSLIFGRIFSSIGYETVEISFLFFFGFVYNLGLILIAIGIHEVIYKILFKLNILKVVRDEDHYERQEVYRAIVKDDWNS